TFAAASAGPRSTSAVILPLGASGIEEASRGASDAPLTLNAPGPSIHAGTSTPSAGPVISTCTVYGRPCSAALGAVHDVVVALGAANATNGRKRLIRVCPLP